MFLYLAYPFERLELACLLPWVLFLFGGFCLGKLNTPRACMASSCTLVPAAWSRYLFTQDPSLSTFSLLIAMGMTLGCIGGLFLAERFPLPQPVLCGIMAFDLRHIAYLDFWLG